MHEPEIELEALLTLAQLSRMLALSPNWIAERVAAGLIEPAAGVAGGDPAQWRFDALVLRRVRTMSRVERSFDAVPELAALVADLEDEIAALRGRLARLTR